jgi:hypothetical protein
MGSRSALATRSGGWASAPSSWVSVAAFGALLQWRTWRYRKAG